MLKFTIFYNEKVFNAFKFQNYILFEEYNLKKIRKNKMEFYFLFYKFFISKYYL